MATNILEMDFNKVHEEDPSYEPNGELEENSQELQTEEEPSLDMDQIPVGKVQFTKKDGELGEALVFANEDAKVTTINEMNCNDTLDEDDCIYNPAEDPGNNCCLEKCDQQNLDCENCPNNIAKKEDCDIENAPECAMEDKSQDEDCDEECEDDDENDEDLKNFEVVQQNNANGEDCVKMKFKDVEEWKKENEPECENGEEAADCEEETVPKPTEEEPSPPNEEDETYDEEADKDYNPIYNNDTLSDVDEPEDKDDDDLNDHEVVYTNDNAFCMLKVPQDTLAMDSREEMECC